MDHALTIPGAPGKDNPVAAELALALEELRALRLDVRGGLAEIRGKLSAVIAYDRAGA